MQARVAGRLVQFVAAGLVFVQAGPVHAQLGLRDGFETPEIIWREAGGDARYRTLAHERVTQGAHSGNGCELLTLDTSPGGSSIFYRLDLGRAPVIPELSARIWIRSDRPGAVLLARVVFPRTIDPQTQAPVFTFVRGTVYEQAGAWQQLSLDNLPMAVARQVRVLRSQLRIPLDTREALLDQLLLNVYCGAGPNRIWTDDLAIDGLVQAPAGPMALASLAKPAPPKRPAVELNGSMLMVEGRPFFPRIIQFQGEPLATLRELGFNGVRFSQMPSPQLLAEAQRLGLNVVCPPPAALEGAESPGRPAIPIGPEFSGVIAWDMGERLTSRELPATKRWAEQVRRADLQGARPIICEPDAELRSYSRAVDVLVMRRMPLGTSFELADFRTWVRERPRLARPGTPFWTVIQTQPAPQLCEQWNVMSRGAITDAAVAPDQLRLLVYAAMASGTRGLLFDSHSPLSSTDEATRLRAMTLELLNMELQLVEPWAAAGSTVANVSGVVITQGIAPGQYLNQQQRQRLTKGGSTLQITENAEIGGVVLQVERGHLLLPLWASASGQFVPGQSAGNGISFIVPGVPEANDVHEITLGGLWPLRHQRVTGGIRVNLDELGVTSMVVLTQDPLVISNLSQRLAQTSTRAAQLQRELAMRKLQSATQIDGQLAAAGHPVERSARWLTAAQANLQESETFLATNDLQNASLYARRSMRPVSLLERAHWTASIKNLQSPVSSPLSVTFVTLPEYWKFSGQLAAGRFGRSLLPQGDFENLERMLASGWQHFEHPQDGVKTTAELSPVAPKAGRSSLRLAARAVDERAGAGLVETPPVWVTSPPINLEAGTWVRISGWAYVPLAIAGSLDGLMVLDSYGGEALAERVGEGSAWKPFAMYRAAPRSGPLTVTIALTGYGEAWVDDLVIEPWLPPGAPAEPPASENRTAIIRLPAPR